MQTTKITTTEFAVSIILANAFHFHSTLYYFHFLNDAKMGFKAQNYFLTN